MIHIYAHVFGIISNPTFGFVLLNAVYFLFLVIHKNVPTKIIPFTIDVEESAHQIPLSPIIPPRRMANGILALVKIILIIVQSLVLPSPDNAPTVVSSTHIKASLKPMMLRYPTAVAIAFGSWKKILAIGPGTHINIAEINTPQIPTVHNDAL